MAITKDYYEVINVIDTFLKEVFRTLQKMPELEVVRKRWPSEDLLWLDETLILPFWEGIQMLRDDGIDAEMEDLSTRNEIRLGELVREKYKTDYYILDKFPVDARPFYTHKYEKDPNFTNSFDIFIRGQEICSGGQRIHNATELRENIRKAGIVDGMDAYLEAFDLGAPPHGGAGLGLERIVAWSLQLVDVRYATLYHRDPKSLPERNPGLPHPECDTRHPKTISDEEWPLAKLIANYGDASNTSWLEPKFEIWRDEHTGAAVGFVPQDGFAITIGNPLCHVNQYTKTIGGFLRYIKKDRRLKPLWLLCGKAVEDVLSNNFDWRTFSVAAEQRLDPGNNPAAQDPEVTRKIRHAEKEGIKVYDIPIGTPPSSEVREKVDKRILDWLAGRKGKQVHLTDVHPWQDVPHRQYHYSMNKEGVITGLVILAQLSPDNGWQVKFSLDFPGAPNGAIELLVMHALKAAAASGATSVTFGGGASASFTPGHNLKGARVKVLSKAYKAIATELKLTNKSEFREKLGAQDDPIYSE